MGMSNSLEIRNPFLDSKMLDLVKYMELTNVRVPHKKELMQFIAVFRLVLRHFVFLGPLFLRRRHNCSGCGLHAMLRSAIAFRA